MIIINKTPEVKAILIQNNIEFKEVNKQNDEDIAETILKIVSKVFNIPVDVIKNKKTRKRAVVYARHISRFFIRENTLLSLSSIGWITAAISHATVLSSGNTVDDLNGRDKQFTIKYNAVKQNIDMIFKPNTYSDVQIAISKILKASDKLSKDELIEMMEDILIDGED